MPSKTFITIDMNWWCTLLGWSIASPRLTTTCSWPLKNFSSKKNTSSHHIMALLEEEALFYIAVQKWMDVTTGHNNKVLEELNVTATSDGYILFLFWKKCTIHHTIHITVWFAQEKNFSNRGCTIFCYISLFYTWWSLEYFFCRINQRAWFGKTFNSIERPPTFIESIA